jgi:hypothetical protein
MRMFARSAVLFTFMLAACTHQVEEGRSEATALDSGELHYRVRTLPGPVAAYATWEPWVYAQNGYVYGYADGVHDVVKLDQNDQLTILVREFELRAINEHGVAAGCFNPPYPTSPGASPRAGLVLEDGTVQRVPPLPGETWSCVEALSKGGTLLVHSGDGTTWTDYVALNGEVLPVTPDGAGLQVPPKYSGLVAVNDSGEVAGYFGTQGGLADRGFRYDPHTGTTSILEPLPCDQISLAWAINEQGDVFGFSETPGLVKHVGKWNRDGEFETLLTEGDAQFPVTGDDAWNGAALVVVSNTTDKHTYVVQEPAEPIDLAMLLTGCSAPLSLDVAGVNSHGDFVATNPALNGPQGYVFLREDASEATAQP